MTLAPVEQRNQYKGSPERPWIRVRLVAPDGTVDELDCIADTGNPLALIIRPTRMSNLQHISASPIVSNFGPLDGGWLRLAMPDLGLGQLVLSYASDDVVSSVQISSPDFEGLAGLPLLRLLEYGGNATEFWVRRP